MPAGMPPPWCPPPPGDLGPESGSAWCLGRRSSGRLGVGARPAPPPVPSQRLPGRRAGPRRGRGVVGTASSAPSAPPTSLAPDAGMCHTRPHALLHLEGSSPGEDCSAFRTQLWPSSWMELSLKAPSPRMPCPSVSLLQFHRADPLPCTRAAHMLLCILHRTVAATCRSLGGTYNWPQRVLGLEVSTCGCSCLSGRPWGQRGSSLFWATGASSTTEAPSRRQSPASAQHGVVRHGLQSQQACVCPTSLLEPSSWNPGFLLRQVGRTALHLGWGFPVKL